MDDSCAIYIHWPFCAKKCPYCDFNSHVRDQIDQANWRDGLLREIDTVANAYPNLKTRSVFFGGGTPSLMPAETVAAVIERIDQHWSIAPTTEITLEANPSSVEASRFMGYRAAGVNRLSLGIQSLYDDALKFLGRLHDSKSALNALNVARTTFDRVSFDLIYARPDHIDNQAAWQKELETALSFDPVHLSLYQLTIEEGTAFALQYARGRFQLPDEDEALALYELTGKMTDDAGLPAYEVSNYAKTGEQSEHNLAYWQGRPYVGIGPGAHGRLPHTDGALATAGIKRPENWLDQVAQHGHGYEQQDIVPTEDRMLEAIMMGLRLRSGISFTDLGQRIGTPVSDTINMSAVTELADNGFISWDGDRLKMTQDGQPLLNALLDRLIAG